MKISVDDKELFTLTDIQKKVICNEINEDIFEDDMKRRLQWVLMYKYERCLEFLKQEWDQKLIDGGLKEMPIDPDEYAKLVLSQSNYMSRKNRDSEANIVV